MTRRKSVYLKWTLVLLIVLVCPCVYARPQEAPAITANSEHDDKSTQTPTRDTTTKSFTPLPEVSVQRTSSSPISSGRDVKSKTPIRDSIEMVAIQLLNKPNTTIEAPIVSDTRIPPKLKTQMKHKIKTRNDDSSQVENAHPGEAVPVTIEELDTENKIIEVVSESSTSNEGISTWISLSSANKENIPTEPTKVEEKEKKTKPIKNKPKRPQTNKISKRPIIGSTNKADLVAGGSAINENVYNKIKDTVLANVQKHKNAYPRPSTTSTTTTEISTTKKETKTTITPSISVNTKPKKKNKNKQKFTTTVAPTIIDDSALLPTEAKEQEIELEVSTPATTTKKPKRNSNKKKNKTKKRKTSTPKPSTGIAISDVKTSNKTKSNKNTKKPVVKADAITTQLYNYLSREVMPSVGVGVLGLASLVGIAGYFLYPFATPVRRTFEVDKSDDLYRNNAEEYANDGNGQAEEEMLGTVLAGMPAHAKQKLNPYAAQTPHISRYPIKKEQDIRYRHVTPSYNPNYKVHYPQQKTGIAHAAVYSKPIANGQYETRHAYTTEGKYNYVKPNQPSYTPYSSAAVEPIYAAPQTGPSGISSYGSDSSNSVVYGVKPSSESDFKPVYPFEGQHYSETTNSPVTHSPTSMYLSLKSNADNQEDATKYDEYSSFSSEGSDKEFVVGNVPKELSDSATPAVVPEHGPRKLRKRRSISDSLEEYLSDQDPDRDLFISNEIDDYYSSTPQRHFAPLSINEITFTPSNLMTEKTIHEPSTGVIVSDSSNTTKLNVIRSVLDSTNIPTNTKDVQAVTQIPAIPSTEQAKFIESISTAPITNGKIETDSYDDPETLDTEPGSNEDSPSITPEIIINNPIRTSTTTTTTTTKKTPIWTTTEDTMTPVLKYNTFTTIKTTVKPTEETKEEITEKTHTEENTTKHKGKSTEKPDLSTYPPPSQFGITNLLQKLVLFKLKLGLGIIQSTVDVLNKLKVDTKSVIDSV